MNNETFPITPPPELVYKLFMLDAPEEGRIIAAYRAGADHELDACCKWLGGVGGGVALRAARRPKPPSLKEQAKFAAAVLRSPDETCSIAELQQHWHTICTALEQLND